MSAETFAEPVGQENVIAGTDCGLGRPRPSADRLGQAARPARRRSEQEIVELNSRVCTGFPRVLLRPFHRPGRAFLLVLPRRHPIGGGHLRLSRGAFRAHAEAPERQEAPRLRERSQ